MIITFDHDVTIANNYQTLFIVLYNFIELSVLSDLIKSFYYFKCYFLKCIGTMKSF